MISDDSAIDTIFGAMILIVSCFACSGVVLLIDDCGGAEGSMNARGIEERFDSCLLSTISIDRKVMNTTVRESIQLLDYLALRYQLAIDESKPDFEISKDDRIVELFEFYFSWSDFWMLEMRMGDDIVILIAGNGSRSSGSDILVSERTIQISGKSSCMISFSIEL